MYLVVFNVLFQLTFICYLELTLLLGKAFTLSSLLDLAVVAVERSTILEQKLVVNRGSRSQE